MSNSSSDRIVKKVELRAPVSRVWRALTDHEEFGVWFRVKLENPFVPGQITRGKVLYPGYEHLVWEAKVVALEPEHRFAFTWHPSAVDSSVDYSKEPSTLVEFTLQSTSNGTLLTLTESGFDALPPSRRSEAFRMNENGWSIQMTNIENHVRSAA